LLLAAIATLLIRGILGIGFDHTYVFFNLDGRVLFAAGRTWLQGLNPYSYEELSGSVASIPGMNLGDMAFFYPPQAGMLCILLGALPYSIARLVWLSCNLVAISAIVAIATISLRARRGARYSWGATLVAAVIIGNPFTSTVTWMGQTTLVAFAATYAAWHFSRQHRWILAGLCLGLASFKPQICLLVAFWLLLEGHWRTLAVGALAALALASYPLISQGPEHVLIAWGKAVSEGYKIYTNLPSWQNKIGIESLLYVSGITVSIPSQVWLAASLLATALLWLYRDKVDKDDWLSVLVCIDFLFSTYLHNYDYAAFVPVYVSLILYAQRSVFVALCSLSLAAALWLLPARLFLHTAIPWLVQGRTIVVILAMLWVLILSAGQTSHLRLSREPAP
jgi:hypothetical protein